MATTTQPDTTPKDESKEAPLGSTHEQAPQDSDPKAASAVMALRAGCNLDAAEAGETNPRQRLRTFLKQGTKYFARPGFANIWNEEVEKRKIMKNYQAWRTLFELDDNCHLQSEMHLVRRYVEEYFAMYDVKSGNTHPIQQASFIEEAVEFIVLLRDCYAEGDASFLAFLDERLRDISSDLVIQIALLKRKPVYSNEDNLELIAVAKTLGIDQQPGNEDLAKIEKDLKQKIIDEQFQKTFCTTDPRYNEQAFGLQAGQFQKSAKAWDIEPDYRPFEAAFAQLCAELEQALQAYEKTSSFPALEDPGQTLAYARNKVQNLLMHAKFLEGKVTINKPDSSPSESERISQATIRLFTIWLDETLTRVNQLMETRPVEFGEQAHSALNNVYRSALRPIHPLQIKDVEDKIKEKLRAAKNTLIKETVPAKIQALMTQLANDDTKQRNTANENIQELLILQRELEKL